MNTTKLRKNQKNRSFKFFRKLKLTFGLSGIAALGSGFLTYKFIDRLRIFLKKFILEKYHYSLIWLNLSYNYILTRKTAKSRMGKGKGSRIKSISYLYSGCNIVEFNFVCIPFLTKLERYLKARCSFQITSITNSSFDSVLAKKWLIRDCSSNTFFDYDINIEESTNKHGVLNIYKRFKYGQSLSGEIKQFCKLIKDSVSWRKKKKFYFIWSYFFKKNFSQSYSFLNFSSKTVEMDNINYYEKLGNFSNPFIFEYFECLKKNFFTKYFAANYKIFSIGYSHSRVFKFSSYYFYNKIFDVFTSFFSYIWKKGNFKYFSISSKLFSILWNFKFSYMWFYEIENLVLSKLFLFWNFVFSFENLYWKIRSFFRKFRKQYSSINLFRKFCKTLKFFKKNFKKQIELIKYLNCKNNPLQPLFFLNINVFLKTLLIKNKFFFKGFILNWFLNLFQYFYKNIFFFNWEIFFFKKYLFIIKSSICQFFIFFFIKNNLKSLNNLFNNFLIFKFDYFYTFLFFFTCLITKKTICFFLNLQKYNFCKKFITRDLFSRYSLVWFNLNKDVNLQKQFLQVFFKKKQIIENFFFFSYFNFLPFLKTFFYTKCYTFKFKKRINFKKLKKKIIFKFLRKQFPYLNIFLQKYKKNFLYFLNFDSFVALSPKRFLSQIAKKKVTYLIKQSDICFNFCLSLEDITPKFIKNFYTFFFYRI